MDVLVKFSHGLGDAAQLTCVLQHLAKHRPIWTVDVASKIGKHSAFHGQCRRSWILDRESIPEHKYHVLDLGWYECYSVYADSPCTKVCNCLREVFGIVPDRSLLKYRIEVSDQARQITSQYLSQICNGHSKLGTPKSALPYPVVAIHYEGNTSADKKNLSHRQIAALCRELLQHGYTPLILDWDRRSPLPDQKTIFCPGVGPGDVWDNTGTGDAERLAALIGQCALFIGVDSGPLHVAGATDTPTLGVWKGHSPVQFYDLCPNVTHLVPERWRTIPPCQNEDAARFFSEHYDYRTYRGSDDLESALIAAALQILGGPGAVLAQPSVDSTSRSVRISIRAPPPRLATGNGNPRQASHVLGASIKTNRKPASAQKETLMMTAATLTWELLPGLAREIALGADGSAWCLGIGEMPEGGYSLHRCAADGHLWALNRTGEVFWKSFEGWVVLPGLASEIACGANASAWCLSAAADPSGEHSIHVWNGNDWDHVEGAAAKIAVGPDGAPWIINSIGQIFRRRDDGWELMPGLAREIAVGADGSVWCLSSAVLPSGDSTLHVWNGSEWDSVPGSGTKIAAGASGRVWLVNADHRIYRAK